MKKKYVLRKRNAIRNMAGWYYCGPRKSDGALTWAPRYKDTVVIFDDKEDAELVAKHVGAYAVRLDE